MFGKKTLILSSALLLAAVNMNAQQDDASIIGSWA